MQGFSQLDLSRSDSGAEAAFSRSYGGSSVSTSQYSAQAHGGQQPADLHSVRPDASGAAPSNRAPPAHPQQHARLPPQNALSSQCILHPRKPVRSLSGPTPLDSAESSPGSAADIRPRTPEEMKAHRAPNSG